MDAFFEFMNSLSGGNNSTVMVSAFVFLSAAALAFGLMAVAQVRFAVKRRAAEILTFERPDDVRRRDLLGPRLGELGFSEEESEAIVQATGPRGDQPGFTYSDLTQRLIPAIVLDAYPEHAIEPKRALKIAEEMIPTAPFAPYDRRKND